MEFGVSSCGSSCGCDCEIPLSAVRCPIEHIAEADHPAAPGKLIIATDLAATSKAGTTPREFSTRSLQFEAAPCPANVGADVASGPSQRRRWRRLVGRRFARQVGCRCRLAQCDRKPCSRDKRCNFPHEELQLIQKS